MLRFMIKLPFRIIAAPVWLVLAAVNIVLVFLVGLSAGFCYLIAGISVVTEVLSIGFGISTDWTMKSAIITTVVFVLLPHIGMGTPTHLLFVPLPLGAVPTQLLRD